MATQLRCAHCGRAAAAFTCKCGVPVYCTLRCQQRDWVRPGGHYGVCEAALVLDDDDLALPAHIGAATGRKRVRRSMRMNNRNVLAALNTGTAVRVAEVQQDLQPFDIYVRIVRTTQFWRDNIDADAQYTVFAPDNRAMIAWLRKLGLAVALDQSVVLGSSSTGAIDLSRTLDAFEALDEQRKARALTILLAHFIPGVRPLYTGLERGPMPLDRIRPVQRRGLSPLTALGVDTEWEPVWAALPDERFFRARHGRVQVSKTGDRGRPLNDTVRAPRAGFSVQFERGGGPDADLVNDPDYILRPRNGYVYRITEVLSADLSELRPAEIATLPPDFSPKADTAAAKAAQGAPVSIVGAET